MSNPMQSIGMKLFLIFFIGIVVFVMAVGVVSYQMAKSTIKDKVVDSSVSAISQAGSKLDIVLSNYALETKQFVADFSMTESLEALVNPKSEALAKLNATNKLQTKFEEMIYTDSAIKSLSMLLTNGTNISTDSNAESVASLRETEWFKAASSARGEPQWIATEQKGVIARDGAGPTFGIARFVTSPSGEEIGVLVLELKYEMLANLLSDLSSNVQDGNSVIIINPVSNTIMYADGSGDSSGWLGQASVVQLPPKAHTGSFEGADQRGEQSLVVYFESTTTGWNLINMYPTDILVKDTRTILNLTGGIAILAAILSVFIGLGMVRMVGQPLAKMSKLMKQGAQGDLQVRASFQKRSDEIGELGSSFNEMMENIAALVVQTNQSANQVVGNSRVLLDSSRKTADAAKEISLATEEIASGAAMLAVQAEQGTGLTVQIGQQLQEVITSNEAMYELAQEVRQVSEQGAVYMNSLRANTKQTEQSISLMINKVNQLQESTSSIRSMLVALEQLTKQTNILSLNATIEAVRSGANGGKGFMVVASEFRKLAEQSKRSIEMVNEITDSIQADILSTVDALDEARPIFQEQIASVKEADMIFTQVHQQMTAFMNRLGGVTASIQQLDQSQVTLSELMSTVSSVSQQSSATSEEVASHSVEQSGVSNGLVDLAEQLEQVSESLHQSLARFTV
ncbi:methyl-accepting chemotaxis protein (plasmid) [Paenibacillus cellulosilyticus]|nr:methyl-accepting chemotaxis protein [Paenibacillus cellulosilyticus]